MAIGDVWVWAGLNKVEFGCRRDLEVETTMEVTVEGVKWSLNSAGDAHPYIMGTSWIAFDPVGLFPPPPTVWVRDTY